jgi:hypothetical protein
VQEWILAKLQEPKNDMSIMSSWNACKIYIIHYSNSQSWLLETLSACNYKETQKHLYDITNEMKKRKTHITMQFIIRAWQKQTKTCVSIFQTIVMIERQQ